MKNHPKDRHVLATAIRARCEVIVTFNLKDFPEEALLPWGIEAHHPSKFLSSLYSLNARLVVRRLREIGEKLERSTFEVLQQLADFVPSFVVQVASDLSEDL